MVTTTVINTKIREKKQRKIPVVSDLVKKTVYDGRILEIEGNYNFTSDHSKFTSDMLDAKIRENE